jgi:DNA-binding MarR family transcriptional regulator
MSTMNTMTTTKTKSTTAPTTAPISAQQKKSAASANGHNAHHTSAESNADYSRDHNAISKYEPIVRLIAAWEAFEIDREFARGVQTSNHDAPQASRDELVEFHAWLGAQLSEPSPLQSSAQSPALANGRASMAANAPTNAPTNAPASALADGYMSAYNVETRIGVLIGRMWRFAKFYIKKALEHEQVSSLEEFTFLSAIRRTGTPTKTEVCVENLTELTTGTEILRRMIKAGFVEEFPDANDRRVKRLRLTPAGEGVLLASVVQMRDVTRIVVGRLNTDEKHSLVRLLDHLDHFHTDIYATQRGSSVQAIITENLGQ